VSTAWHDAWVAALDELELTLDATERLLDDQDADNDVPSWTPPVVPGPMPTDLAARAQQLLDRQSGTIRRAVTGAGDLRQRLYLLGKLNGGKAARAERPVYVDLVI
jgi:hypothetical protein